MIPTKSYSDVGSRQLTDSDLKHTGKAEDSPSSQRSDRSWRVWGARRAWWPRAPAHWEVSVREKDHDLLCFESPDLSKLLFVPGTFLLPVSLLPALKL